MTDKMDKAISFFKRARTGENKEALDTTGISEKSVEGKPDVIEKADEIPMQSIEGRRDWKALSAGARHLRKAGEREAPDARLQNKVLRESRRVLSSLVSGIRKIKSKEEPVTPVESGPDVSDKEAPEMLSENSPVHKGNKVLSLFAAGRGKVSALFAGLRQSPSKAAPAVLETGGESPVPIGTIEEICVKGNGRRKAGWISPDYSKCRTVHLDPGFVAENRCLAYLNGLPGAEAYRIMRTQIIQRTKSAGGNLIMVTSAMPGEGKTLTAINLSFTLAREYQHTVLLIDADLRKQSIHKCLGCAGEKGLIDYLADGTNFSELITYPGIEKMTLISGGRSYKESAEILGSPRMKELVADMKVRYPDRFIIFDVPPILTGADVLTLAPLVDQVVVVVRAGSTSMDDVKKALQFLPKEKILGFVLNRAN